MNISIASGKGGTGKTTFAVNLAYYLGAKLRTSQKVTLLDCDVEEPNCHLFVKPEQTKEIPVTVLHPVIDNEKCDGCGRCVEKCNYNALALVKKKVLLFDELCHSCGLCKVVCPRRAIKEVPHQMGKVILNVEQASSLQNVEQASSLQNVEQASSLQNVEQASSLQNVEQASSLQNVEQASSLLKNIGQDARTTIDARNTSAFMGLDYKKEISVKERNLPHWDQDGVTYFVTFRLADSIPVKKIKEWKHKREIWEAHHSKPYSDEEWKEYNELYSTKVQNYLDKGMGECSLKYYENSKIVEDAFKFFDKKRYILDSWVVMPNHIHALVTPMKGHALADILFSWKSFTANKINKNLNKKGTFWLDEGYDHIVRNKKQLIAIRKYILNNPNKANINVHHVGYQDVELQNVEQASSLQNVAQASSLQNVEQASSLQNVEQASSLLKNIGQDARTTLIGQDARTTLGTRTTIPFYFGYGLLNIGESLAPNVVKDLKKHRIDGAINIIDSSPGTGCPVVESLSDADVTVLVTEPTPFGLHDLKLAVQLSLKMRKPTGIVINRSDGDDKIIAEFAEKIGIPILGRIPFNRKYAEAYSKGKILVQEFAELADIFGEIYNEIIDLKTLEPPVFKEENFLLSGVKKDEVVFEEQGTANDFKEIIVISGKGGTGKTTITSSLAQLAKSRVSFDTDVDAADLQLLLKPTEFQEEVFISGQMAHIDSKKCISCGLCKECHFDAISLNKSIKRTYKVDEQKCEGCGFCAFICPVGAITMSPEPTGKCFISKTDNIPMSHAELGVGAENSGKLVTQVRNKAAELANKLHASRTIGDGPPGTGCPVIASVTGVDLVIIVTEPTVSGLHDMERVIKLTKHFGVKTSVIINKADLNKDMSNQIHEVANSANIAVIAEIPFDRNIHDALMKEQTIIEYAKGEAYEIIKNLWSKIDE